MSKVVMIHVPSGSSTQPVFLEHIMNPQSTTRPDVDLLFNGRDVETVSKLVLDSLIALINHVQVSTRNHVDHGIKVSDFNELFKYLIKLSPTGQRSVINCWNSFVETREGMHFILSKNKSDENAKYMKDISCIVLEICVILTLRHFDEKEGDLALLLSTIKCMKVGFFVATYKDLFKTKAFDVLLSYMIKNLQRTGLLIAFLTTLKRDLFNVSCAGDIPFGPHALSAMKKYCK